MPKILDAAASAWLQGHDFAADYEYEEVVDGEMVSSAKGMIAFEDGRSMFSAGWNQGQGGLFPYPNFSFSATRSIELLVVGGTRVQSPNRNLGDSAPNGFASSQSLIHELPSKLYVIRGTGNVFNRRPPLSLVPNPIGFCCGWSEGVVFGGLEFDALSAKKIKSEFSIGLQKMSRRFEGDELVLSFEKKFIESVTVVRETHFGFFSGAPVKIREVYRSFEPSGRLRREKITSVGGFVRLESGSWLPKLLEISDTIQGGDLKRVTLKRFCIKSIRRPVENDFLVRSELRGGDYQKEVPKFHDPSDGHWFNKVSESSSSHEGEDSLVRLIPVARKELVLFNAKRSVILILSIILVGVVCWKPRREKL